MRESRNRNSYYNIIAFNTAQLNTIEAKEKSKKSIRKLLDREIVKELKGLASTLNIKLERNYSRKSNEWILAKIIELKERSDPN